MQSPTQLLANLEVVAQLHTVADSVAQFGTPEQSAAARQLIQQFADISLSLVTEVTGFLVSDSAETVA